MLISNMHLSLYYFIYIYIKAIVVMRRMGALDCLHDLTLYLYYALCFMLVEHSVCHEPISVLINVFMLLA